MFGLPVAAFVLVAILVSAMTPPKQQPASSPGRAATSSMHRAIGRLADATAEYGAHLESHTSVVKGLATTTRELSAAVSHQRHASEGLRNAVARQNRVLQSLESAVGGVPPAEKTPGPQAPDGGDPEQQKAKAA